MLRAAAAQLGSQKKADLSFILQFQPLPQSTKRETDVLAK